MTTVREVYLEFLAWLAVAVLGGLLAAGLWACTGRKRIWPPRCHGATPWTGFEVLLAFFALVLWPALFQWLTVADPPGPDTPAKAVRSLWITVLTFPCILATIGGLLYLSHAANRYPLTWTLYRYGFRRFGGNVLGGYLAWLVVSPVVLLVHNLTELVYELATRSAPVQHQLVTALQEEPTLLRWGLVLLSAVIVAPILEEILFRGLLQGWMTQAGPGRDGVAGAAIAVAWMLGDNKHGGGPVIFMAVLLPGYVLADAWGQRWLPRPGIGRAIYGSSMLFAAFHAPIWPTPIPLFLLGLGLGFLAYRTQSLVGPVVLHGLFNAVACVLLFLGQGEMPEPAKGRAVTSPDRRPVTVSTATRVPGS